MGWFFGSSSSSPPKPPHSPYAVQEQAPPAPASPELLTPGPTKQGIRAVILGPAGAGKYDQADRLAKKYASCHLTIGEILQSEVRADTPLGQKVRQMAKDEGQLIVSDELIFELIDKNLVMAECRNGYIFDDFPHNKEQAQKLDKLLEDRRAPLQVAVQLAIKDQKQPPENAEVINYYAKRGLLAPIDVSGSVDQVEQKLDKVFNSFFTSIALSYMLHLLLVVLLGLGIYGLYKWFGRLVLGKHQHPLELQDRTVLIIGASTSLDRALAFEFYTKGAKLILAAHSRVDTLDALTEQFKLFGRCLGMENLHAPAFRYLDVSELNGGAKRIRNLCTKALGGETIDVLVVNCVGLSSQAYSETPLSEYRQQMKEHLSGLDAITRALLECIPNDGAILNINDIQGRVALPYRSPYSCSKHAVQAFFESFRGRGGPQPQQLQIHTLNVWLIKGFFGADPNQLRGMSAEDAAARILHALQARNTELFLAPLYVRLLVLLHVLAPERVWGFLRRRYGEPARPAFLPLPGSEEKRGIVAGPEA